MRFCGNIPQLSRKSIPDNSTMRRNSHLLLSLIVLVTISLPSPNTFAQLPPKKRPELKQFGSSLKRLKWDPASKQAVQTKQDEKTDSLNEGDVVRIDTSLVTSDILVADSNGRLVQNLTADDFVVTEDEQPQKVAHFFRGDKTVPRSIVLIIDYSGCYAPFLRTSVDAAKVMVDKLAPQDVMAIATDDVEMIVNFTNDKNKLKKKLEWLWENHHMRLGALAGTLGIDFKIGKGLTYSALMATLREAFIQEDLRPIIVFQTDGNQIFGLRDAPTVNSAFQPDLPDELKAEHQRLLEKWKKKNPNPNPTFSTEFSVADVYRAVEKSRATIYTVVPGFQLIERTPDQQLKVMRRKTEFEMASFEGMYAPSEILARKQVRDSYEKRRAFSPQNLMWAAQREIVMQDALATVAAKTGGWTEFLENPEDADGVYNRIMTDINHRYIIGYYPTNKTHDGAQRKINVQVKGHPDYYVLGRKSYYAPAR